MGVQSLWTLLEPCGRRVNIEALTNKRLAVGMVPHQYSNLAPLQQPDYVRGLLGVCYVYSRLLFLGKMSLLCNIVHIGVPTL